MSAIVIYDPLDPVVSGRVINYLPSANTPDYESNPNALINPDLSGVAEIDQKYWKVADSTVVPMTDLEKGAVDEFLLAKTNREKKYQVVTYNSVGRPVIEAWYDSTNQGDYSGVAEITNYVYGTTNLISKTVTTYFHDGIVQVAYKHSYYINSDGQTIEKIEEI